jgi:hypothetical protein
MQSHIKSKLISALKVCVSIIIFATSTVTYAEYYIVYPGPYIECASPCCGPCPCYHYLHFVSRHRHNHYGDSQVEEYAWVGDP